MVRGFVKNGVFTRQNRKFADNWRRRTPARGHPAHPHRPRPYYVTMPVLLVHSRDGGWVDGPGGPLRASVLFHHESGMLLILTALPLRASVISIYTRIAIMTCEKFGMAHDVAADQPAINKEGQPRWHTSDL